MSAFKKVCILGGTHGNEMSGIFLVKKWQNNPELIQRPNVSSKALISNPEAVKLTRRYRDCDLNRSFTPENFAAEVNDETPYEVRRVKELKALLDSEGELGCCDAIIDLHNTTSNMKMCLIHKNMDSYELQALKYISSKFPEGVCHVLYLGGALDHAVDLGRIGIGIEVGPQPQGVLRNDIVELQENAVGYCLDFLHKFNNGGEFSETSLETHKVLGRVPFPRDANGDINAVIHPSLQDQDWKPMKLDDPVFILMNGTILKLRDVAKFDVKEEMYPCFINEAAYYEKDAAFFLTEKCQLSVPSIKI